MEICEDTDFEVSVNKSDLDKILHDHAKISNFNNDQVEEM